MRSKAELQSKFKQYMSKPRSKAELQSKLIRLMSKPKRALHKARDFYVKSMEDCASKVGYGGSVMGGPTPQVSRLPRSFSANYSKPNNEDKFMNFLEAMEKKRSMEGSNLQQEEMQKDEFGGGLKRSYSTNVGLARIDEDKPCFFEEDAIYSRTTSCTYRRYYNY